MRMDNTSNVSYFLFRMFEINVWKDAFHEIEKEKIVAYK